MSFNNKLTVPEGFRDIFFESAIKRKKIKDKIENFFLKKGFQPVIPPTVEFSSVFLKGIGENGFYKLIQFFDEKGELLSLGADLTCSVARMVCTTLSNFKTPLKVYYISNIFRKVKSNYGKLVETNQAGVEIIGDSSFEADKEILKIAISIMKKLLGEEFQIVLSHASFLDGLFYEISLTPEKRGSLIKIIQNRNKLEWLEFIKEQIPSLKNNLEDLLDLIGNENVLLKAEKIGKNEKSLQAISDLRKIYHSIGLKKKYLILDLAKVKGFDYYTGIIFSIISHKCGFSVGSGGRYNELLKKFGRDLPAIGFSLNLDLLEEVI